MADEISAFRELMRDFGFPTILLMWLGAIYVGWLPNPIAVEMKETAVQFRLLADQATSQTEQLQALVRIYRDRTVWFVVLCQNTAKSEADKSLCATLLEFEKQLASNPLTDPKESSPWLAVVPQLDKLSAH